MFQLETVPRPKGEICKQKGNMKHEISIIKHIKTREKGKEIEKAHKACNNNNYNFTANNNAGGEAAMNEAKLQKHLQTIITTH